MNRPSAIYETHRDSRAGFTLVEMLVSVTLVLLMMTMFAQIFSVATSSVSKQRVISENDQKARSISTVIRGDVAKRTFTFPFPFYPGEDSATSPTPFGSRVGYIYLNTNDPASFSDDLLQFTVDSRLLTQNKDATEYYGKAASLADFNDTGGNRASLPSSPNQPDVDGGSLLADYSASSPAAQIAYFVRNGNLYRRVVLIRNPIDIAGKELDSQPTSLLGNDFFAGDATNRLFEVFGPNPYPVNGAYGTNRYNDFELFFDFSAIADPVSLTGPAKFLGVKSLSNELASAGAANQAFGNPRFRYGFNQMTGQSREHTRRGDPTVMADLASRHFIGRFTLAETSTPAFNWPQRPSTVELLSGQQWTNADSATLLGNGNPYDVNGCPLSLNLETGMVEQFNGKEDATETTAAGRGGPRQMEDLLLANVQEMRLEVWDSRALPPRFVVPGYGSVTDPDSSVGDYHIRRNLNYDVSNDRFWYGPLAPYAPNATTPRASDRQPHVFDTWHPNVDIEFDGVAGRAIHEILPPYIGYKFSPPRRNAAIPGPSSAIMPNDVVLNQVGNPANQGYWQPNTPYELGDVVFVQWKDAVSLGGNGDTLFTFNEIDEPKFAVAYRCIDAGTSGTTGPSAASPGQRISDGTVSDQVLWESFDNRVPLTTIRMTLRYINETSGDPRQLTLVLPVGP
jgi:type II secretory pathway pseudopilin PulG